MNLVKLSFEVAPAPQSPAMAVWNALPMEERYAQSCGILHILAPVVGDLFDADLKYRGQLGGYAGFVNPSFFVEVPADKAIPIAAFLGYVLSQESIMMTSSEPFEGSEPMEAVVVDFNGDDKAVEALYHELYAITSVKSSFELVHPIEGFSYVDGKFTILDSAGVGSVEILWCLPERLDVDFSKDGWRAIQVRFLDDYSAVGDNQPIASEYQQWVGVHING